MRFLPCFWVYSWYVPLVRIHQESDTQNRYIEWTVWQIFWHMVDDRHMETAQLTFIGRVFRMYDSWHMMDDGWWTHGDIALYHASVASTIPSSSMWPLWSLSSSSSPGLMYISVDLAAVLNCEESDPTNNRLPTQHPYSTWITMSPDEKPKTKEWLRLPLSPDAMSNLSRSSCSFCRDNSSCCFSCLSFSYAGLYSL